MIRVAIVGTGAIAPSHLKSYLAFPQRCEIVALADIYPEKAQKMAKDFGLKAKVVDSHKALLDDDSIDLVSVCTPPYTHAQIAIDFLTAGKHVLVEKPMASSLEECDAMNEAAARSGRVLSVVAQNRFRTEMMKLKGVLDAGLIGPVLHAQVDSYWWRGHSYYDLWWRGTWEREGGGCTLNHAVHHLDALLWMMGEPKEVHAIMGNVAHDNAEVEDISIALFKFESGALGQATSSVVHHGQEQQLVFQGARARVSVPWKLYASSSLTNGFPKRDTDFEAKVQSYYDALPQLIHEHHQGQIDDVLKALETGAPVYIDGIQGRRTLELITAIYKSATTKSPVTLPLASNDEFYRRDSLLQNAIHFHEKTESLEGFANNVITTEGNY